MRDEQYMRQALDLARNGEGKTSPNPMVGAIIVKDSRIIGQGWHEGFGLPHAERNALTSCIDSPNGATLYVNLEPCCHHGKTPPCTDAILEAGISRVVIGMKDPNPLVAGRGAAILRERGVTVDEGILEEECRTLNEGFLHYIRTGMPYVVMKYAMTMDGKIAMDDGTSKWITGEEARRNVHKDRRRHPGIMVGIGTILADDPLLTCRLEESGRTPIRIICDTGLKLPLESRLVSTARDIPTLIATTCEEKERHKPYLEAGCEIMRIPGKGSGIDLHALMVALGRRGIESLLLEGGGRLHHSALESGIVNKIQTYIAPMILGGREGKTPVAGGNLGTPGRCIRLVNRKIRQLGEDLLIESEVEYPCLRESSKKQD